LACLNNDKFGQDLTWTTYIYQKNKQKAE